MKLNWNFWQRTHLIHSIGPKTHVLARFSPFRLHESRCKIGRTGAMNAQVRQTKMRRNFSQRAHLIHSIVPKTHVLGRFGPFRYCPKVDAKLAELAPLTQKFVNKVPLELFTTNTPIHSIGPKTPILAPFGPFHYCTKVDAKLAELHH
jgi:hypothetical protein